MSTFSMPIEIAGPDRERFETVNALVGTNATYTMLPASLLTALGVSPIDKRWFRFQNGERIRMDIGEAVVRIDGRAQTNVVVFADEDSRPILGMVTLEAFSVAVDTVNQRLIPKPAFMGGENLVLDPVDFRLRGNTAGKKSGNGGIESGNHEGRERESRG